MELDQELDILLANRQTNIKITRIKIFCSQYFYIVYY